VLRQRDPDQAPPDLPQAIVDQLPALAADEDVTARRNVIYGFARFRDVRGLSMAIDLSADSYVWTRFFALIALTKIADPAAMAAIEARLSGRSAIVRRADVQAAAAIGRGELLSGSVADAVPHVRSAVATALGAAAGVSDEEAAAWLRRLEADHRGPGPRRDDSIAVRCALLALLAGDPSAEAFAVIEDW